MTRLRSFKHVFSTTSVREGLSVWAKTCFQRGRSFPFLETAGVVRSKHVNLLDSHRPIISASPDFKSRVCRALPSDARKSPAPSVRSLARGAETPRGSPSRVRRVLASNLDPSDPSRARRRCRRAGHPPTPPDLTVTWRGRGVLRGTRCRWSGRARPTARDRRRRGPAMVIRIRRNTKRGTRGELTGQRTHPGRVLPSSCTRFRHASKSRATEFLKFGDCRRCDDEIQTRELGFGPTFVVKLPQLRDFFPRFFHSRGPADPAPSLPGFLSIAEPTAAAEDPRNPRSTTSCTSHRPCARHHPRKAPQRTGGTTVTTVTRWATTGTLSSTRRTGCRRRPPSTRVRSAAPRSARSTGTYPTSWMARVRRRRSLSCRHSRISDTGGETRVLGTRARARGPVRRLYETWRSSSRRSARSSCPRGSSSTITECRTEAGTRPGLSVQG